METRLDGTVLDMGALQYSLGLVENINGQWYGSAPVETWFGNNVTGGPVQEPGQIPNQWFYDAGRWAPLTGYQPQPGEMIGVFVVAGDARNDFFEGVGYSMNERSNIVTVPLPAPGVDQWYDGTGAPVAPPPPPVDTTIVGVPGVPGVPGSGITTNPLNPASSSPGGTPAPTPPPVGPQAGLRD